MDLHWLPRQSTRLLCVLFVLCVATLLSAQGKRGMTLDDVYALKQVSDPQISPDGRRVAYVVAAADFERGRWDSDLWVVDTTESARRPRQLTFNVGRDNSPRWSPDSKHIAFLRTRPEGSHSTAQIYLLTQASGEAGKLTDEPLGGIQLEFGGRYGCPRCATCPGT